MIELKLQRPYIKDNLERHYAEDKYIKGYVQNNVVYKERELSTSISIEDGVKIFDLFTGKTFKFENDILVEDKINRYKIKQNETGIIYDEAVDLVPCKYTYSTTNEAVEIIEEVLNEQ